MPQKGFTLLETMIAAAIMLLLVASSAKIFETTVKTWQANYIKMQLQQNARIAMDEITKNLLGASAATVVIDPAALPLNSKITFQVIKDTGVSAHVYYLSGTTLVRQLNNVISDLIPDVTDLDFTKENELYPGVEDFRCIHTKLVVERKTQKITLEGYTHLRNE
ncbi:MAG: prepilin-type N-terminal cleavage/methylation domain-containing protein [bacterium]|nr:prepilin-type N-terminal cleavage/methylation domain-containing protein [bacterium]MDD5756273.1 prepilin-type N-terminal cleavage/methylation domain-containing protein [bacterium]